MSHREQVHSSRLGATYIGTIQDKDFNQAVQTQAVEVHESVAQTKKGLFCEYEYIDKTSVLVQRI